MTPATTRPSTYVQPIAPARHMDRLGARLSNRLLALLTDTTDAALSRCIEDIERLLGVDHAIFFHDLAVHRGDDLPDDLGGAFTTEFWLPPGSTCGLLAIDMAIIEHWLKTLLAHEAPRLHRIAPLSPRDFGLVTFILLHVLDALKTAGIPPLVIATEAPRPRALRSTRRRRARVVELAFGLRCGPSSGLARLFIPEALISALTDYGPAPREASLSKVVDRFPQALVHATASLGHLFLTPSEVDFLEPGDILLPEAHSAALDDLNSEAQGPVLRLTRSPGHAWGGQARPHQDGHWVVEITHTIDLNTRKEIRPMDQPTTVNEDQTDVLEHASIRVEFGLGRLDLSLRQLARLRRGYVLETSRQVCDGVDIVAGGQRVARGELVDIEGRLGIRVLNLSS